MSTTPPTSDYIRDVPLMWDCPQCGAKAARLGYASAMEEARCAPDCPTRGKK